MIYYYLYFLIASFGFAKAVALWAVRLCDGRRGTTEVILVSSALVAMILIAFPLVITEEKHTLSDIHSYAIRCLVAGMLMSPALLLKTGVFWQLLSRAAKAFFCSEPKVDQAVVESMRTALSLPATRIEWIVLFLIETGLAVLVAMALGKH